MKKYFLSQDFIVSLILSLTAYYYLPNKLEGSFCKELLNVGINVLALVFSIFFAALAFLISSSDDKFVTFLEESKLFTKLISTFKWTLSSLFLALMFGLILFIVVSFRLSCDNGFHLGRLFLCFYCFLFFYSLIATILSTNDAIKYAQKRTEYTTLNKDDSFLKKTSTKKKNKR